jgi:hypothetical protein
MREHLSGSPRCDPHWKPSRRKAFQNSSAADRWRERRGRSGRIRAVRVAHRTMGGTHSGCARLRPGGTVAKTIRADHADAGYRTGGRGGAS